MTADPDRSDLVVLGGGSGGYACALRAAELGLSVVLVEAAELGGTCLHRGCIPTKAWLHAAEVADAARHGSRFGIRSSLDGVDVPALRSYADGVVGRLHRGLGGLVRARGIEVVPAYGRLELVDGEPAVRAGDRLLRGDAVVVATGSRPRTLPGIEVDGERVLTSDHALRLDELPRRAVVLGGGVIGCEFASAWRSLGVEVTVVEALDRLLPAEQPESSAALQRAFGKRGIQLLLGQPVTGVRTTDGGVEVAVAGAAPVEADVLLVAVGRGPVTDDIGADEIGLALDRGFVAVDERLATSVPGVWAVGDVVAGLQLAHRGFGHGIFVAEEVAHRRGLAPAPTLAEESSLPRITYSDPEVASVGLTTAQAEERHGEVTTLRYDLAGNGRSQILQTSGFVQVVRVVDGPVVGVHMVGSRVGELVAEAQLVVGWEAWPQEVAALVHPHPTQSEALGEAHLALAGKPLHVHG
ncbi:dihydrolipoyl dehydrogenase [Auraticoccus sp. F435]|uniref:Dihydrolipoyl dehydrogenase n=1 Tax=Auraticoccus cholistanensis TaxID=2656650 RepID=A0A6A9UZC3_9ACTN|nr:dihydrolipoyl dehydrogenase [Auraticoccus cholistanensis]MVA77385.1 dihydrolipoyl dehydrogenase [Auraticoccus cholistanensis]